MDRKTIGRYEILDELGSGAMGSVLRARDPAMNRIVAIKSIRAAALAGEQAAEFRERFHREATAAGALSHPGIVPVFDVGEDNGLPFLVMELVEGRTLEAILKQGERYPLSRVCQIGQQIAEALGYAHRCGIVHRDIKPANILMTSREVYGEEYPRITDFGVAKIAGCEMTSLGQLLGTPAFMPPEQFTGSPIDGRADLFALGVILYRMTTGELPFSGETLTAVSYKIVHTDPVPPSKLNPAVPFQLETVILKCLAKNPVDRFQSGEELAANLGIVRMSALEPLAQTNARTFADALPESSPARFASTGQPPPSWPVMESAASVASRTFIPNPHPDAFVSQTPPVQTATPVEFAARPKDRSLLVLMWAVAIVLAVLGTRFLLHLHMTDTGQQNVAPAAASTAPDSETVVQPVSPRPAAHAAAPPGAGAVPGASTPAVNFNPKTLNPGVSARLKLHLEGFSAPLVVTLQMDGKLYWSGTAGDQQSYQGLLVPPGWHDFRVVVKGDDAAKMSNSISGYFASRKELTLSVKLQPSAAEGSAALDPSARATAALAKDALPH